MTPRSRPTTWTHASARRADRGAARPETGRPGESGGSESGPHVASPITWSAARPPLPASLVAGSVPDMADRVMGRPRQKPPLPPDAPITAPDVEPAITVAQLDALAQRLGCQGQTEFGEALGISQSYLSNLYSGYR